MGITHSVTDTFALGGHFDFNFANYIADVMDVDSKSTSFALGLHSQYHIAPKWYINGQITGAITKTNSFYKIKDVSPMNAQSSYNSESLFFSLHSGYAYNLTNTLSLSPEIGVSYLSMHTANYDINWKGAFINSYDLSYDDNYYNAIYGNVALHLQNKLTLQSNADISLLASFGLRQKLNVDTMKIQLRTLNNNYTTYSTEDISTWNANAGFTYNKNNFSLSLNYNGSYSIKQNTHGGKLMIMFTF